MQTEILDRASLTCERVWRGYASKPCDHIEGAVFIIPRLEITRATEDRLDCTLVIEERGIAQPDDPSNPSKYYTSIDTNTYYVDVRFANYTGYERYTLTGTASTRSELDPSSLIPDGDGYAYVIRSVQGTSSVTTSSNVLAVNVALSFATPSYRSIPWETFYGKSQTFITSAVSSIQMPADIELGSSTTITATTQEAYVGAVITHSFAYDDGSGTYTSMTVTSGTTSGNTMTYSWTPDISMAALNTNGTNVPITVRCTTLIDGSSIGNYYYAADLTIPQISATVPGMSLTYTVGSDNPTIASWGVLIDDYTYVDYVVTPNLKYGATVSSITYSTSSVTDEPSSTYTIRVPVKPSDAYISVRITDSRGFSSFSFTNPASFGTLSYSPPAISDIQCFRCDSNGTADSDRGTYISAQATKSYSPVGNNNSCTVTVKYAPKGSTPGNVVALTDDPSTVITVPPRGGPISRYTYQSYASVIGGGAINGGAYTVVFTLADAISSVDYEFIIPACILPFNIKDGGDGVAFGGYSITSDSVHIANGWKLIINDNIYGDTVPTPNSEPLGRVFFHVEDGGQTGGFYRCTPYIYTDGTYDNTNTGVFMPKATRLPVTDTTGSDGNIATSLTYADNIVLAAVRTDATGIVAPLVNVMTGYWVLNVKNYSGTTNVANTSVTVDVFYVPR